MALSITITMCTTLLAPVLTPSLTLMLAGQWIDVNFWNMFISIVLVVLLPILLGIAVHTALGDRVNGLKDFLVKASTACIILVEGLCVGPNRDQFTTHGVTVVLVTVARRCAAPCARPARGLRHRQGVPFQRKEGPHAVA